MIKKKFQKLLLKLGYYMTNLILILGASSDLGCHLISNIKNKCTILAHYNSSKKNIDKVKKKISNEVITLKADLSSENNTKKLINLIKSKYGIPNKIINFSSLKVENIRFKDLKWSDYQNEINVSLRSSFLIFNAFLPYLNKKDQGRVVIVLSSYVIGVPPKNLSNYITIKYAMLGLMKTLASEYSEKNILINSISPSMIETKFLNKLNKKIIEINSFNNPLKRNANPKDITPILKLLLFGKSNYLSGINIPITGGSNF